MRFCLFVFSIIVYNTSVATPKPTETDDKPEKTDSIATFPIIENFKELKPFGPNIDSLVDNIVLYDMVGNKFDLYDELKKGKPILLVLGSYTCPKFRFCMPTVNEVVTRFSDKISTFIIYSLEAHPHKDTSAYFGYVNPGKRNLTTNVLYNQPKTYGERIDMVNIMYKNIIPYAPILLDGINNEFLNYFGPSPNNAYFIDVDKKVKLKYSKLNPKSSTIIDDISNTLKDNSYISTDSLGLFSFELKDSSYTQCLSGNSHKINGILTNKTSNKLVLDIFKTNQFIDTSWQSAFNIEYCLPTTLTRHKIVLEPNSQKEFGLYIFPGSKGYGKINLMFRNSSNTANTILQEINIESLESN